MASRSYNPSSVAISNSIEDTLEYYNMRKNPNSQPMIFKYPPKVVIRDTYPHRVERLYGGGRNMKMLEMDAYEPQRRPSGFVAPHSIGAKKYISNGNSASYPVFNAVEQKSIDSKKRTAKATMEGEGIWEDMNKWGKQNEENVKALAKDPRVQAIINDPRVQSLANQGKDYAIAELKKKVGAGVKRGRGRPRKGTMEGDGIWEDMNAWGKQNEQNFNKFGRDVESTAKGILANPQVQAIMNDPAVQKLGKSAVKSAVSMIPVIGGPASTALGMMGWGGVPRATIVKKIMAEKNMSMIEASKYVKANNLYIPKPKTPRAKK